MTFTQTERVACTYLATMLGMHYTNLPVDPTLSGPSPLQQAALAIQQVTRDSFADARERLEGLMDYQGKAGMQILRSFAKAVDTWMDQVQVLGSAKNLIAFILGRPARCWTTSPSSKSSSVRRHEMAPLGRQVHSRRTGPRASTVAMGGLS